MAPGFPVEAPPLEQGDDRPALLPHGRSSDDASALSYVHRCG